MKATDALALISALMVNLPLTTTVFLVVIFGVGVVVIVTSHACIILAELFVNAVRLERSLLPAGTILLRPNALDVDQPITFAVLKFAALSCSRKSLATVSISTV